MMEAFRYFKDTVKWHLAPTLEEGTRIVLIRWLA